MKEIPCRRCGRTALGPPTQANPGGEEISFSRFTGSGRRPIILKCHRCGDSIKVDELMFNGLPEKQ